MSMSAVSSPFEDNPLVKRRPFHDEAKFDITAMIDLVFMMNIFFLVTTVTAALAEIDLPTARHCAPADRDSSVIFTILAGRDREPGQMTIDEGLEVLSLADIETIERRIREAVEGGVRANRNTVLIKAEKSVHLRDVSRVGAVAVSVPGTELKLAVVEKE